MNEDYLWNKTGADPEVEQLENALKSLRYRANGAPPLPVRAANEKKFSFKLFPFAAPIAACLLVALFTLGFWLKDSARRPLETAQNANSGESIPQSSNQSTGAKPASPARIKESEKIESRPKFNRKINERRKIRQMPVRPASIVARKIKRPNPTERLTVEEQYAYDQLMTALAITGARLQIVKNKIQNTDN